MSVNVCNYEVTCVDQITYLGEIIKSNHLTIISVNYAKLLIFISENSNSFRKIYGDHCIRSSTKCKLMEGFKKEGRNCAF
jgi:hypothetical protein